MLAALIKNKPKEILKIYNSKPFNINISNLWSASNVDVGYKTPDNNYEIVNIIPFSIPEGKRPFGEAFYEFDENNNVVQKFQLEDIPVPPVLPQPKIILATDFISRFTDEEYSNIKKAALAQMQQGVATLQKWIDVATTDGYIDLDRPATNEAKKALISANLLTQERADIIFSIQENNQ